jgi:hypothetical protein
MTRLGSTEFDLVRVGSSGMNESHGMASMIGSMRHDEAAQDVPGEE